MKRLLKLSFLVAVTFLMVSCSSTMKHTWTQEGYTGKHFDKILVIGASRNLESRSAFENTTVELLAENGIKAENSLKVLPPVQDVNEISEELIEKVVKEGNYDAVIVAFLVDVNTKDVVETTTPTVIYGRRGYGYGRYVYGSYNSIYSPDYYRQQKTYVVETRLFDAHAESKEQAMVWSGQSNITDPSSFEKGAESYAKTMVKSLMQYKIIY